MSYTFDLFGYLGWTTEKECDLYLPCLRFLLTFDTHKVTMYLLESLQLVKADVLTVEKKKHLGCCEAGSRFTSAIIFQLNVWITLSILCFSCLFVWVLLK